MTGNTLHASAVALPQGGVLLLGAAGSGKSSLAALLIAQHQGQLIADDRVCLAPDTSARHGDRGARLKASPPDKLTGLLELRGLGIATYPFAPAIIDLAVNLVPRQDVPRIADAQFFSHEGARVPLIALNAFDTATAVTILQALKYLPQGGFNGDGLYL